MKKKMCNLCAVICGILMLVLKGIPIIAQTVFEKAVNVQNESWKFIAEQKVLRENPALEILMDFSDSIEQFASVLIPVLFIVMLICLLAGNKNMYFVGKWGAAVIGLLCFFGVDEVDYLLVTVADIIENGFTFSGDLCRMAYNIVGVGSCVILLFAFLKQGREKLLPFGFGGLALAVFLWQGYLIGAFNPDLTVGYFVRFLEPVVLYVLLGLLFAEVVPSRLIKWASRVIVVLAVLQLGFTPSVTSLVQTSLWITLTTLYVKEKCEIWTPLFGASVLGAVALVLEFAPMLMEAAIWTVLKPILLVLVLVCLLKGCKNKHFVGKWGGIATCIFCLLCLVPLFGLSDFVRNLSEADSAFEYKALLKEGWFPALANLIAVAGFVILILSLLQEKCKKLLPFSLAGLGLASLLVCISSFKELKEEVFLSAPFFMILGLGLLALLALGLFSEDKVKYVRNVTLVILFAAFVFGIPQYSIFYATAGFIAWVALTYFLVPGKFKMPKTLTFFVAILYLILAAFIGRMIDWEHIDAALYSLYDFYIVGAFAGLVLLGIGFLVKKCEKLKAGGFGVIAFVTVAELFGRVREPYILRSFMYSTESILYLINITAVMAAAVLLCMLVARKHDTGKAVSCRNWAVACLVVSAVIGATEFGNEMLFELAYEFDIAWDWIVTSTIPGYYLLFCVTTVLGAFVMVPLTYKMEQSIGKFLFLTVITFGVWYLIWIYNVTKHLNTVEGFKQRKPVKELLLCMFLPLYAVYWHYKTARLVDAYALQKNVAAKLEILSLVFAVVAQPISAVLIQDKLNDILTAE